MLKPLHAQWMVNMFNFFTTDKGKEVIAKGWKRSGITSVLDGTLFLPIEDPFEEYFA